MNKKTQPIKLYNTLSLLAAIVVATIALGQGVAADLHVPAARILVAECQGFEALATAGGKPMTCSAKIASAAPDAPVGDAAGPASFVAPVVVRRSKA